MQVAISSLDIINVSLSIQLSFSECAFLIRLNVLKQSWILRKFNTNISRGHMDSDLYYIKWNVIDWALIDSSALPFIQLNIV